jgi:GNAT superfamily N-acetyltransferase
MSPRHIRLLQEADLAFADSLRGIVGWNQTVQDWERFLKLSPEGCFLAEWNRTPAGTATTICYGKEAAWIGMLLVHPDHRKKGIGRKLLTHCLDHLRERQIRCIKLDATPQGKILYDKLGFTTQWSLTRWQIETLPDPGSGSEEALGSIPSLNTQEWNDMLALDCKAFGKSRPELIAELSQGARAALLHRSGSQINGFGFLRDGTRAQYLGPIVANSPEAGLDLATDLLRRAVGQRVFWDIPDDNFPAIKLARDWGFTAQRPLTRMALGPDPDPGNPSCYFGIIDPAVG